MNLLVTGATGFLGRYIVAEALRRDYQVHALVRPKTKPDGMSWFEHPNVTLVRQDLRSPRGLDDALANVDTVIHAAAVKSGDLYGQLAGTVVATENLLNSMLVAGVKRLVAISTFSVYDYLRPRGYSVLDEASPLETHAEKRQPYAQSKLLQEELIQSFTKKHGLETTILRPGIIYGRDNLWTDQLGIRMGDKLFWRFVTGSRLPLNYVENCAGAVVECALTDGTIGQTYNVIDDELPTRGRYAKEVRKVLPSFPRSLPMPGLAVRGAARLAHWTNGLFFRGRAKMPWFLVPAKLHVQVKPLKFSNRKIREATGWSPKYSLAEALGRITETESMPRTEHREPLAQEA